MVSQGNNEEEFKYDSIEKWSREMIHAGKDFLFDPILFRQALTETSNKYDFAFQSLHSFLRNLHLSHVKSSAPKIKRSMKKYLEDYKNGKSILQLSKEANYPPYLFCRYIVEQVVNVTGNNNNNNNNKTATVGNMKDNESNNNPSKSTNSISNSNSNNVTASNNNNNQKYTNSTTTAPSTIGRKGLTQAMRDPLSVLGNINIISEEFRQAEMEYAAKQLLHKIRDGASGITNSSTDTTSSQEQSTKTTTRLATEVSEAIVADPMYGPHHDKERHLVGVEYEVVLEQTLLSMDIPFETESELRERGSSRTPDVLLSCPIGIQVGSEWKVVCWIDSKAMFGDVDTHRKEVIPQAESYIHRFGPGMILYWFGHAPLQRLGDSKGDIVIIGWDMPETFLWPTGEIGRRRRNNRQDKNCKKKFIKSNIQERTRLQNETETTIVTTSTSPTENLQQNGTKKK